MRRMVLGWWVVVSIVLNAAPFASAAAPCSKAPASLGRYQATAPGRELPQAGFLDAGGTERSLADFRGQGLVLNFWATWCAPCVKEMPALDRLAKRSGERGLRVMALSADREGAPVVRKFYDVNDIKHLDVAVDKLGRAARAADVSGLPTTVLYDGQGREVGRVVGVAEWDAPDTLDFLGRCLGDAGR